MNGANAKLRRGCHASPGAMPCVASSAVPVVGLVAASAAGAVIAFHMPPALAQQLPTWQPQSPQYVQCPAPGQPLLRIPELVSQSGQIARHAGAEQRRAAHVSWRRQCEPMPAAVRAAFSRRGRGSAGLRRSRFRRAIPRLCLPRRRRTMLHPPSQCPIRCPGRRCERVSATSFS